MAKLLENTYRHINIALVNEMTQVLERAPGRLLGRHALCSRRNPSGSNRSAQGRAWADIASRSTRITCHTACAARLGYPFRFVELAQEINRGLCPGYVASRAQDLLNERRKCLNGSSVLLLGVGYKPGISDQRESPAIPLAELLLNKGANVSFYDALIREWTGLGTTIPLEDNLREALSSADIVVHLQPHADYDDSVLAEVTTCLLDTTGN